jgi:hypothetical protein
MDIDRKITAMANVVCISIAASQWLTFTLKHAKKCFRGKYSRPLYGVIAGFSIAYSASECASECVVKYITTTAQKSDGPSAVKTACNRNV